MKQACGFAHLNAPIDLASEAGEVLDLQSRPREYAKKFLEPRGIYVLCKYNTDVEDQTQPSYTPLLETASDANFKPVKFSGTYLATILTALCGQQATYISSPFLEIVQAQTARGSSKKKANPSSTTHLASTPSQTPLSTSGRVPSLQQLPGSPASLSATVSMSDLLAGDDGSNNGTSASANFTLDSAAGDAVTKEPRKKSAGKKKGNDAATISNPTKILTNTATASGVSTSTKEKDNSSGNKAAALAAAASPTAITSVTSSPAKKGSAKKK